MDLFHSYKSTIIYVKRVSLFNLFISIFTSSTCPGVKNVLKLQIPILQGFRMMCQPCSRPCRTQTVSAYYVMKAKNFSFFVVAYALLHYGIILMCGGFFHLPSLRQCTRQDREKDR